jgi:ribosome biogenesis GTPase
VVECRLRGRLKKVEQKSDIAVIGDMVMIDVVSPGYGAVESVLPRTTRLSRVAAFSGGSKEDVIVANVDVAIIVVALAQPEFHPRMLDRYLVICENNDIEARIVASKADLVTAAQADAALAPYRAVGYTTCVASIQSGQGLAEVESWLPGKVSVVTDARQLLNVDTDHGVHGPTGNKAAQFWAICACCATKLGVVSQYVFVLGHVEL